MALKRRDFLKVSAALALTGVSAACGSASAAASALVPADSLVTNDGDRIALTDLAHRSESADAPAV